ncbi:inverse autotransporter beta domain-containing protein, partial [Cedecea davisae]|uniref:inverse autotransporter beta domain-containing protein n=1 Tax=Cedecea davisae TaxID=158484 RepID=UPI00242F9064
MKHKNMDVIRPGQRRLAWLNIGIQAAFPLAVAFAPVMAGANSAPRFLNAPAEQTLLRTRAYSLSSGESVTSVAQKFNMSVDSLRKLNQLRSFARGFENLRPGDELDVPLSPLPKVTWDESKAAGNISGDQQAHKIAGIASQAGSFITGGVSKDAAASMARSMAAGKASGQLQEWLSRFGTARVQLDADENFSLKNSQFDLLAPLYDQDNNLVFTQGSLHRTDDRTQANLGFGLRHFAADYMVGGNTFGDYDLSREHARMGMGVEYWRDFLKLSANGYMRLTGWKDSPDVTDYEERPANGWDVRAQGWLPQLPQLGGKLTYEQYYGNEVALFGKDNRQSNPYAITAGLNYTPVPLVTFSAEQRQGHSGKNDTRLGVDMTYQLGVPWNQQINPAAVAAMRSLAGSRYDLVERNNNIVLEYRKKEVIHLQAAAQVTGYTGEQKPLNVSVTSKYGLERIDWSASSLVAAGGKIVQNGADYAVELPVYQPSAQGINSYTLSGVAVDKKGNRSNRSETQITVQASVINAENSTVMPASSTLVPDGKSIQVLTLALKDTQGLAVDVPESELATGVGVLKSAKVSAAVRKEAGVYEVTVTAGTDEEKITLAPQVRGITLAQAEVLITAPAAVQVNSAIKTDKVAYIAGSDMALTVTLKDAAGAAITGATSQLTTDSVKVPNGELKVGSSWQDNGDGSYSATYIAKTEGANLKATVTLNGWSTSAESAAYAITSPEAVQVNSGISVDSGNYLVGNEMAVTVTLKDVAGKAITGAASQLTTESVKVPNGELKAGSSWQDNGDGSYSATYIAK